jgi:hypothetical protein
LNEPTGRDEQQVLDATYIFREIYMLQYSRLNCMPLKDLVQRMQANATEHRNTCIPSHNKAII